MTPDGPPESERQLNQRPDACPFCGSVITDEYQWSDAYVLIDWLDCSACDWDAYVTLEVNDPDAE